MTVLMVAGSVAAIVVVLVLAWLGQPDPPTWLCVQCGADFTREGDALEHVAAAHGYRPRVTPLRWHPPRSPLSPPWGDR